MKHIRMFYATWCGPCKMTKPIIEQIEKEQDVLIEYYDIDEHRDFALSEGVKSIPTIVFYENGKEYNRTSGYQPKQRLLQYFNNEV